MAPKGNEIKINLLKALELMPLNDKSTMLKDGLEALKQLMSPDCMKTSLAGWKRS